MSTSPNVGVRRSVRELQTEYDNGNKQPLEDLVRAWKGIKELPSDDPNSFFVLGGYHGEPFHLRPPSDRYVYWGGYCNHGNVLFPTWHRIYVRKLEEALQSIVPGVMMPYWDETSDAMMSGAGIPSVLTADTFELDGETIPNPLKSFTLPEEIRDDYWQDNVNVKTPYYKPKGYETVRYPLSGLVGNPESTAKTASHNQKYADPAEQVTLLNQNVQAWLVGGATQPGKPPPPPSPTLGVRGQYDACLRAPNYTVFSNTTSMSEWNTTHSAAEAVVALEQPHNAVHLAVGGFDYPEYAPGAEFGLVAGANGDMGENNTAALDPIFFFHHCFVDRQFWLWQQQNPDKPVEIEAGYPGTDSSASQGPTPGFPRGMALTMDTHLNPFTKPDGTPYTSRDCVDVEAMGYTYAPPPQVLAKAGAVDREPAERLLVARGLNRAHFRGSFVISAWGPPDDEGHREALGHYPVLSRWNVEGCANCQTHLDVVAHFPVPASHLEKAMAAGAGDDPAGPFHVTVSHRGTTETETVHGGPSEKAFAGQIQHQQMEASKLPPVRLSLER